MTDCNKNREIAARIMAVLSILSLPYNNFPFIEGGTLKPLSFFPLLVFFLCFPFIKSRSFISLLCFFLVLPVFSFISLLKSPEVFELKKVSFSLQLSQFIFNGFVSLSATLCGYFCVKRFGVQRTAKLLVLAWGPTLCFFVLYVVLGYAPELKFIREIFVTTEYPVFYYRFFGLTTEPSWYGIDIVCVVIPACLFLLSNDRRYLVLLFISLMSLLFVKSILSVFLLLILMVVWVGRRNKVKILAFSVIFYFFAYLALPQIQADYYMDRLSGIASSISQGVMPEESSATRIITTFVGLKVFLDNMLFGIGPGMFGYYYVAYAGDDFDFYFLLSDYSDPLSSRFADVKNFFVSVLVSGGLVGGVLMYFSMRPLKALIFRRYFGCFSSERELLFFRSSFFCFILAGFSISLVGYPPFWFVFGVFLGVIKVNQRTVLYESSCSVN